MARERLLLDTSVVVHLLRGKETGERIDRAYNLRSRPDRPLISAGVRRHGWPYGLLLSP